MIAIRTNGVINGSQRNSYGECAAYIAAFGEALTTKTGNNEKQRLCSEYRKLFPRHSAFIAEMAKLGYVK